MKQLDLRKVRIGLWLTLALLFVCLCIHAAEEGKPLILQEMSWVDVQANLENNDMVIIPIGSTEQHGPHLPLGTDSYVGLEVCRMISSRTGVVVAPVLWSGYSVYHSGFPGVLSLKPETMEQVLYETASLLITYGFDKILFFNSHGGNRVIENNVIHKINHTTEAIAVAIGIGSSIQKGDGQESYFFDNHAGLSETSEMLFVRPDLVNMERAKKAEITFTPMQQALLDASHENPDLMMVWNTLFGVPVGTKKGGASHEISSNGIWSFEDPASATRERGEISIRSMADYAVKFIQVWKKVQY